jgi:hypothetical protein
MRGGNFCGFGTAGNSSRSVITHTPAPGMIVPAVCYWMIIFVNMYSIDIIYGPVVRKAVTLPVAAFVSDSVVPMAVIDSAVITDMPPPISVVVAVAVAAAGISPKSGSP